MQRPIAKPWFRRRRVGIGWRPVTWEGWLITLVAVVLVVGVLTLLHTSARVPVVIVTVAAYVLVALRTGGAQRDDAPPPKGALDALTVETATQPPAQARRNEAPVRTVAAQRERPAVSGPPALIVEQLTKRFGDRVAVNAVSFTVAAGEVFGFLGPNGAGKTTTVRMLSTLITPTSGSALVAGVQLDNASGIEIRQRIAVMPENPGLYLRLTVGENLEFFAGLYSVDRPQERIRQALDAVNLAGRANDPCGSLSKGLRQRVALARTLLSDPAIVFLDEPTSGLDPVATARYTR